MHHYKSVDKIRTYKRLFSELTSIISFFAKNNLTSVWQQHALFTFVLGELVAKQPIKVLWMVHDSLDEGMIIESLIHGASEQACVFEFLENAPFYFN